MSKQHNALWMVLVFLLLTAAGQIFADSRSDEQAIEQIEDVCDLLLVRSRIGEDLTGRGKQQKDKHHPQCIMLFRHRIPP